MIPVLLIFHWMVIVVPVFAQHTELALDENVGDAIPNPDRELLTTSSTRLGCTADDVPTDTAAGPDQTPAQPKIKFPSTLKGNKYHSFALSGINSTVCLNIQER